MTKLLFGQSYFLRFDPKLWAAMQPYPPLGTLFAASDMRERGYEVALFDAMLAESEDAWAAALTREQPDVAIIYEDNFNYLSKMCLARMREAAFTMIGMGKAHGCTVIVCGSDATDHSAMYLHKGADYVLVGEGEETLAELLAALTGKTEVQPADVVAVATPENPKPARRSVMRHLDALPLPAFDLVDVAHYRAVWMERHGYFAMNMATTRGCPYHCNWCAKPIWGQRYNVHSPAYVVRWLKHLKDHYQPDYIWFADDIMGLKPGWMEQFADLLEAENVRVPFKCLSRADLLLRGETIPALKRAGCDIVWVGAESGAQKILDAMEKGTRVEEIRAAAAKLHEHGVRVGFFLQFGYPGETREDIEATLQLVRDCEPDDIGISVSYPLPGTTFFERVKDELGARQNWQDSSDLAMLYAGPFTTAFYRQLHTVVHKEFRARKTRAALPKATFRDMAAMVYHTATLPLARRQLDKLAALPHEGVIALQPAMDYAAAATPTPQQDEIS
ncbi:MAG: radical SAM protein [Anaerolineae bacterium]